MVDLSPNDKKNFNVEMLAYGYKMCQSDFFNSNEYNLLKTEMLQCLPKLNDKRLNFKLCDKATILRSGKYVIDKHTDGMDIKIPYADNGTLQSQLFAKFGEQPKEEQIDEIVEYINNKIQLIEVTDIPVQIEYDKEKNAHTHTTWFYGSLTASEEFFKKVKVGISKITIEGKCDEQSKSGYVHEMYHALSYKNKGSTENLLHEETLPIFMEKVAALDIDSSSRLEDLVTLYRLVNTKRNIIDREMTDFIDGHPLDIISDETYILSTANATALFNKYKRGSNRVKQEIDNSINGVISGNYTVEDVLKKYDVTPEEGSKIMRKQIRKFSK